MPKVERYGVGLGVPVILHHGFLIDFNSIWYQSGTASRLAEDGLEVVLIVEHFLREAGDAHAFGHDVVLLLAEMLADVVDELGRPEVDILAAGSGAAPALVAAANDDRIRRLVLADPDGIRFGPGAGALVLDETDAPTLAELDLRIPCSHAGMPNLAPAPNLSLAPEAARAQTLILADARHSQIAETLSSRMPNAEAEHLEDVDAPVTSDSRFAAYVSEFLLRPVLPRLRLSSGGCRRTI